MHFYRNLTFDFETLRWWLYMRSTESGPGIILRGVWKFAMTWIEDLDQPGFHVVATSGDEWVNVPAYEIDFRRLPANDNVAIRPDFRWW